MVRLKAIILLGTLKKTEPSNTEVLSEFLAGRMSQQNIESEVIKLVEYRISAGTYSNMGTDDEWPIILRKILAAEIIIFATPIWWGNQSSEIQRVIERLDELHDEILRGERSRLLGKAGGIVITGDSDGAQHIIGNIANFFNALGLVLPPHATLSVLWEEHAKHMLTSRERLLGKYQQDYIKTADTMISQLIRYVRAEQVLSL